MRQRRLTYEEAWGLRVGDVRGSLRPEIYAGWNPVGDRAREQFEADPRDAYWARRLCEALHVPVDARTERLYTRAVACVVSTDWYLAIDSSYIGLSNELSLQGQSASVVEAISRRVRIGDPSLANYTKGKLWLASMVGMPDADRAARALLHLRNVTDEHREHDWLQGFCLAAAWADYPALRDRKDDYVAASRGDDRFPQAFRVILSAAVRHRDWRTYDEVRAWYERFVAPSAQRHDAVTVAALDGWRGLATGRIQLVEAALRTLIESPSRWIEGIGLVSTLAKKRLLVEECREWLRAQLAAGATVEGRLAPALRRLLRDRSD
jgi:hypothetical protein